MTAASWLIRARGVVKRYGASVALNGMDLDVAPGELFGLIGPDGAGKSSLLRTINRLEQPSSGRVLIDQVDIGDFDEVGVIEVLVKVGDTIRAEQSLVTVESDKASMEIPSSHAGVVKELKVKLGDKIAEGSVLLTLETAQAAAPAAAPAVLEQKPAPAPAAWYPSRPR